MKPRYGLLLAALLVAGCHAFPANWHLRSRAFSYQVQKKVTAENGAVVSAHPLASQVGINILRQGGNVVDAAIATQLALSGSVSGSR